MFKWPNVPSPNAAEHELADFAELLCWRDGRSSATALMHSLARLAENDYSDGVPEDDMVANYVENAYVEIERRARDCGEGYPFALGENGDTLRTRSRTNNGRHAIYKYLLLATRLNMRTHRNHAEIDGTLLFEELSAETCKEYFGDRTESMVFGTAAGGTGFEEKVEYLCMKIGEGNGYEPKVESREYARDGKLDVVAWKHFTDRLPGKLIAFGQCKTGTNFRDDLAELQPESFCKKWMRNDPALFPMRMFFVAEALPRGGWYNFAADAGLLLDRCRIVDFSNHICRSVSEKVEDWTAAAACSSGLPSQ